MHGSISSYILMAKNKSLNCAITLLDNVGGVSADNLEVKLKKQHQKLSVGLFVSIPLLAQPMSVIEVCEKTSRNI